MNTKATFASWAEQEEISFAPPLLTLVPQRDCPQAEPRAPIQRHTPVAGIPLR